MLNVTKSFLPPFEEYQNLIKGIWENSWLTNNGPLVQQLEAKLKEYLGVKNLLYTNNGTIVLQMALKSLGRKNAEIITTPFSYVATTNSILWEGLTPVFVDINNQDFNIDADLIENAITNKTAAILATHVYGNPCDIEKIKSIGEKYNLPIIYDAAHAFGATYKGEQILSYGDIATCSFHATKVFHTVEGGCIIANNNEVSEKLMLMRQFGHIGDEYFSIGINGKSSEFHAAMGLCNLPYLQEIIAKRKEVCLQYDLYLDIDKIQKPIVSNNVKSNHAYYPIIFENEKTLLNVKLELENNKIFTRRYFYPSLNNLPFVEMKTICKVSDYVSKRALSLPLSADLPIEDVKYICKLINQFL